MADKVEYHFQQPGMTEGQSGTMRTWEAGETQVLPEGELSHVPDRHYETRPLEPDEDGSDEDREGYETRPLEPEGTGIEHHGGAYYKIRIGGEIVTGDDGEALTVRGKDAARDKLQDLR